MLQWLRLSGHRKLCESTRRMPVPASVSGSRGVHMPDRLTLSSSCRTERTSNAYYRQIRARDPMRARNRLSAFAELQKGKLHDRNVNGYRSWPDPYRRMCVLSLISIDWQGYSWLFAPRHAKGYHSSSSANPLSAFFALRPRGCHQTHVTICLTGRLTA